MDEPVNQLVTSTVCHDCQGEGWVRQHWGFVPNRSNQGSTMSMPICCKTCQGSGNLKGFVPPV